jgi:hypothetical protein
LGFAAFFFLFQRAKTLGRYSRHVPCSFGHGSLSESRFGMKYLFLFLITIPAFAEPVITQVRGESTIVLCPFISELQSKMREFVRDYDRLRKDDYYKTKESYVDSANLTAIEAQITIQPPATIHFSKLITQVENSSVRLADYTVRVGEHGEITLNAIFSLAAACDYVQGVNLAWEDEATLRIAVEKILADTLVVTPK